MQLPSQDVIPCELIASGVDWITSTAKTGGNRPHMDALACNILQRSVDAGEDPKVIKVLGFTGYSTNHFFYGERHGEAMIRVSSAKADDLWRAVSEVSDNVSRVDLQATVYTYNEQPHVARNIRDAIRRKDVGTTRIRNATYIENHPKGESISINKRCSSISARAYDKATEARLGLPRSVWRYEIECHSRAAGAMLAALRSSDSVAKASALLVRDWFEKRGIRTLYTYNDASSSLELKLGSPERNTLTWFRDTLSKTVHRQVMLHGREIVLQALGLADRTNPN